jgi:outer membrane protein assembly factor BamB
MAVCAARADAWPADAPNAKPAADRSHAPKLPLAEWWRVTLDGEVGAGPVADATRVYLAFKAGDLVARAAADGHELWRVKKNVTVPMAAGADLLFVAAGDAVEAIRGADGRSAWVLPRATPVAPLVLDSDTLFVVTEADVIAVRAATGEVIWRHAAGGAHLAPAIDPDSVYLGADDGRVVALKRTDGSQVWERFFRNGVTAIGAGGGRVYIGAGDKVLYCVTAKKASDQWTVRVGSSIVGRIPVDDDHAYVAARDNVVRGLDRKSGNQRWNAPLHERPTFGVYLSGHVVFVPAAANSLAMLYDRDGRASGTLSFPGDQPQNLVPAFLDSPAGAIIYVVTGGLTNEWHLTKYAPAGEAALIPFAQMETLPGLPYLTDPGLRPLANVLQLMLIGDPLLQPFSAMDWPVILRDPPLLPLTALPGLQLRQLSPALPVRRGGLSPAG